MPFSLLFTHTLATNTTTIPAKPTTTQSLARGALWGIPPGAYPLRHSGGLCPAPLARWLACQTGLLLSRAVDPHQCASDKAPFRLLSVVWQCPSPLLFLQFLSYELACLVSVDTPWESGVAPGWLW